MSIKPADPNRCQTMITPAHGPFVLGPREPAQRCPNKPVVIAREAKPGRDGARGEMSLCASCREVFVRQMPAGYATFRAISEARDA